MNMNTSVKPVRPMYWLHGIIFMVLTIGIGFLPTFGQITLYGMDILGVFIGLVYGWVFIGFIWPSLFGLVVLGYTNYAANVTAAVANGFAETLIWQIFFMLIFADLLKRLGVTEYIGYWFLSRKICIGRPWIMLAVVFIASFICGGIISIYGTIFMLWAIIYEMCKICNFEKKSSFVTYTLGGIVYFVAVACMVFPFRPYPSVVLGLCAKAGATELPFAPWLFLGVLMEVIMIVLYLLVGRFIFKFDLSALAKAGDIYKDYRGRKMESDTKMGMILLVGFVIILTVISLLPVSIPLVAWLKNADMLGLALLIICFGLFYRRPDGTKIVDFHELAQSVSWDIIIMFAVTLPVCTAMGAADTGIVATLIDALLPFVSGLSPAAFLALVVIVFGLITQVAHNLVLTMTLTPVLAIMCTNYGVDPLLFGFIFVTVLQCATATPAASAQAALVFANTEWVNEKKAYQFGVVFLLIAFIVLLGVIYPLGRILF